MVYKIPYTDLHIPEQIIKDKDVSALSDFSAEAYGKPIDKRFGWEKALKAATNYRRTAAKHREEAEKEQIMDKQSWSWKEGFKFFCDGPDGESVYLTRMDKNTQFFVPKDQVKDYLDGAKPTVKAAPKSAPKAEEAPKEEKPVDPPKTDA